VRVPRGTEAACLDGFRKQLRGTLTPTLSQREREEERKALAQRERETGSTLSPALSQRERKR